jgi:intein/homing endonuclease
MDGDNEEPEFQIPVTEDSDLYQSTIIDQHDYRHSTRSRQVHNANDEAMEETTYELVKDDKLYQSENLEGEEDEESTFGDLPEDKIIERQFMLEQARIEEALNMIANLEIVNCS